jgi:hypothetical protein
MAAALAAQHAAAAGSGYDAAAAAPAAAAAAAAAGLGGAAALASAGVDAGLHHGAGGLCSGDEDDDLRGLQELLFEVRPVFCWPRAACTLARSCAPTRHFCRA